MATSAVKFRCLSDPHHLHVISPSFLTRIDLDCRDHEPMASLQKVEWFGRDGSVKSSFNRVGDYAFESLLYKYWGEELYSKRM